MGSAPHRPPVNYHFMGSNISSDRTRLSRVLESPIYCAFIESSPENIVEFFQYDFLFIFQYIRTS